MILFAEWGPSGRPMRRSRWSKNWRRRQKENRRGFLRGNNRLISSLGGARRPTRRASRPFWSSAFLAVAAARYLSSQQRDDSVIIAGTRLVPTAGNNRIRRLRLWFLNKVSCSAWRAAIPWLNPSLPLWLTVCLPTDVLKPASPGLIHRPVQPSRWAGLF